MDLLLCDDGMTVECTTITPADATTLLQANRDNRNIRPNHVAALARDMSSGRWKRAPMPIVFDVTGRLIDGQHRLLAIERSETPIWSLIVRGVDTDVQEVIDTSAARTGADALRLSKRVDVNHPAIAAVARALILYSEGHHQHFRPNVNGARKVTNSEITEWVDAQKEHEQFNVLVAVATCRDWSRLTDILPLSVQAIAYMLLSDADPQDADAFFTSLNNSEFGDGDGDPIRQLYDRMNLARLNGEGLRIGQQLYFIFTAWNAYRQNQPVTFVNRLSSGKLKAKDPSARVNKSTGVTEYPRVPMPV